MIDNNYRYQKGLTLEQLFPKISNFCACGCGEIISGNRKKWASNNCRTISYLKFAIIKGDNYIIRQEIFKRDNGFCQVCGVYDEKWQVDHILPIINGGGGCSKDNLQTLCIDCHNEKTYSLSHHKATSSQAASIFFMHVLNAEGAYSIL